jgi:hypothetical protein
MARPTYYFQRSLTSGDIHQIAFTSKHYAAVGVPYSPLAGMPELEAYQLINKWNTQQVDQRFVYGIEG